jgi:hypothetical protein
MGELVQEQNTGSGSQTVAKVISTHVIDLHVTAKLLTHTKVRTQYSRATLIYSRTHTRTLRGSRISYTHDPVLSNR